MRLSSYRSAVMVAPGDPGGPTGQATATSAPTTATSAPATPAGGGGLVPAVTPNTITDVDQLRAELAVIRTVGFATSVGERLEGVASVAAPVFDYDGYPVAVLAVSGPSARLDPNDAAVTLALVEATRQLSAEMGHGSTS